MKINVVVTTVDYAGRSYDRFCVRRSPQDGPGWYVFGRNPEYNDSLVHLCARPNLPIRRHPHYSCKVARGWHLRSEAQAVADLMNKGRDPNAY